MNFASIGSIVALTAFAGTASAGLVDLSGWTKEGGTSTWTVAADKSSVFQSRNGAPAIFFSGSNDQGKVLSGKIKVETTRDDDYIGFALGYNTGNFVSGTTTNFILIDWKQLDQGYFGCTAKAGLAISRVTAPHNAGAWCHDPAEGVTELARAATLGSTGWADNTEYALDVIFTASNIQVKVNGTTQLNVSGAFADGSFGFYNYSQSGVRYSALAEEVAPRSNGVPEPTSIALVGLALFAAASSSRKRRKA